MKEERFEIRYAVQTANGNWSEKVIYNTSKEKADSNKARIKELGYKFISCKKLYPFSTMKNQHNFNLISDICHNRMHDMEMGEVEWNDSEYDRLENMKNRADEFFCLPLPIAWLPWEDWKDAKELSENAIVHRQNACIANGRLDLVKYC